MADTIRNLERSKFEFEQSVRELSDTNKDLNNDVKRLEQKLEIYTELFDKDSHFHSSLKRRSYQGDPSSQEQADEKLIENALAPLMEEIKEKDFQIRNLQKAVEEKEVIVNSLNKEIDTLETNLAAMVTEKIRNMQVSSDAEKIRQQTTKNNGAFSSHTGLFSNDSLQELKQSSRTSINNNYNNLHQVTDDTRKIRIGEPCTLVLSATDIVDSLSNDVTQQQVSPGSPNSKETYLVLTSKSFSLKDTLGEQVNNTPQVSWEIQ